MLSGDLSIVSILSSEVLISEDLVSAASSKLF